MNIPFPILERRFQDYAARYFDGETENDYHIDLKLQHSLRVYALARRIVEHEPLGPDAADIALVAALFHDTGRFEQFRRYRTFHDPSSANHARLGVRALLAEDLLRDLPGEVRRTVLGAVFLHNVRALPEPLREPLGAATRVVRDSDKLDIIPVVLANLAADGNGSNVVTLGLDPHPASYTRSIYDAVLAGKTANYAEMRWFNDFRLLLMSWIADLNFPTSLTIFRERGYADTIFDALPDDEAMRTLRARIDARLAPRG